MPTRKPFVKKVASAGFAFADLSTGRAAFLFHLGDVVYYFGQEVYYFDQFYDPYRNYGAPILAIPGNHDGVMYPREAIKFSLEPFWSNFCSQTPAHAAVAQGAVRTTMTQPGVYFTLDAPFLKIIGLYSNTAERAGTISGPNNDTQQLQFLTAQLKATVSQRAQGDQRALIIAVHHPPFTGSSSHFPSPGLLKDLDTACAQANIMPDLVLSGHAHLYERYTRSIAGRQIPYVVAGNGGYYNLSGFKTGSAGLPPTPPVTGTDGQGNPLTLEAFAESTFGFLRLTVSSQSILLESIGVDERTGETISLDSFTSTLAFPVATSPPPSPGKHRGHSRKRRRHHARGGSGGAKKKK